MQLTSTEIRTSLILSHFQCALPSFDVNTSIIEMVYENDELSCRVKSHFSVLVKYVMRSGKTRHMVKIWHCEFLVSFKSFKSPLYKTV